MTWWSMLPVPSRDRTMRVAECCIRHGVHYLDLADDAAFVQRHRPPARRGPESADVLVCAGASTAPALTGAVVEEAAEELVRSSASPSASCPATTRRAGRPWWRRSSAASASRSPTSRAGASGAACGACGCLGSAGAGWRPAICRSRRCSRAASPSATPSPARGWKCRSSMSGCGRCPGWCGWGWCGRWRRPRRCWPRIADRLRFLGTDRGGLRLELQAGATSRVWCLIAEGGDGPFIPVTPAAALVRKLAGGLSTRGAMPCLGLLNLAEIEAEWRRAGLRIAAGWSDSRSAAVALSARPRRRLRPPIARRPGAARCRPVALEGALHRYRRTDAALAGLLAWLFQLPAATDDAPIAVEFAASGTR